MNKVNEKNILLLTTMYPNSLRPATPVCHYFAREWVKLGYNVVVVYYRSIFPWFYTFAAKLFPVLAQRYVGNHVEMDRNTKIIQEQHENIPVYSVPIYKVKPHGKYSRKEINKQTTIVLKLLKEREFTPDAIIGHFYNPCLEIVSKLKSHFRDSRTCISFHETMPQVIKENYKSEWKEIFKNIDVFGYRSLPIKKNFESIFGQQKASLICPSGTSEEYNLTPLPQRLFTDAEIRFFLYVGQFIKRKYPELVVRAIDEVYDKNSYHLEYIGELKYFYQDTLNYVLSHDLHNNVILRGKVKRDELIKYYDAAECFIMISRHEVFGLVYLEAMSRGCITIAGKNEGMEGIIIHGVNGFLCEPGNLIELEAIIRFINSLPGEKKQEISKNAIETARIFSDKNVAESYIDNVFVPGSNNLIGF